MSGPPEPTDEALRAFAGAVLSHLPETLAEPAAIDEAVTAHRDLWVMLYRAELEEACA